jgi:hypothetical protein
MLLPLRGDTGVQFNLNTFIGITLILLAFFGMRMLFMYLISLILKLKLRFRPVEDWFGMSLILGLGSGLWIPVPGNLYPKEETWTYREISKKLGLMAFIGSFIIVGITWTLYFLPLMISIPPEFQLWYLYGLCTGAILSFMDVAFPFFPLEVYNGKRIYHLSKILWVVLALLSIAVFVLAFFFRL